MKLTFSKMHALGNDFVIVDVCQYGNILTKEVVQKLCHRHFGVGCDQLLALAPASVPKADFDYWIFNGDGGRVYQCGNGARCLAAYAFARGYHAPPTVNFYTGRDLLSVALTEEGEYQLQLAAPRVVHLGLTLDLTAQKVSGDYIDLGNPHFVIEVDDIMAPQHAEIAGALQRHEQFPYGVNVGFAHSVSPHEIKLRVFERGAGETLACGSGAIAAAVALRLQQKVEPCVTVEQAGGRLQIDWPDEAAPVTLIGPATHVFDGEIEL